MLFLWISWGFAKMFPKPTHPSLLILVVIQIFLPSIVNLLFWNFLYHVQICIAAGAFLVNSLTNACEWHFHIWKEKKLKINHIIWSCSDTCCKNLDLSKTQAASYWFSGVHLVFMLGGCYWVECLDPGGLFPATTCQAGLSLLLCVWGNAKGVKHFFMSLNSYMVPTHYKMTKCQIWPCRRLNNSYAVKIWDHLKKNW